MRRSRKRDVTGSIAPQDAAGAAAGPAKAPDAIVPTGKPHIDALPASISPAMRQRARRRAIRPPNTSSRIRYAEGRGVPQSSAEAARWLERAAHAGFAPAQFRLAGLNEKGDGVKKDMQAARKLYLAAAGKGHAKAMHNLAVLYAEGIDGKPDYKAAAQWFQKASLYGVTDSQYNLAILYARGIGIEPISRNPTAGSRWPPPRATTKPPRSATRWPRGSIKDAGDGQGSRSRALPPEREPDEAINLKAPPGGWDKAPAAQAKSTQARGAVSTRLRQCGFE